METGINDLEWNDAVTDADDASRRLAAWAALAPNPSDRIAPRISWVPALSVGIASIDAQHRVLLAYINLLATNVALPKDNSALGKTIKAALAQALKGMADYTKIHFAFEERLFKLHGYEHSEEHEHSHRSFETQLQHFVKRFEAGDDRLAKEVLDFLVDWLKHHILVDDKAYSAFFARKGVK
ncbi:MAG: bacteriohemerythrin [Xanthomonadales bacterium]|jgi:hemerythrin-like metal-binding protein|nr:bacteriohemerythrin [Xanthomonadales bacterium]